MVLTMSGLELDLRQAVMEVPEAILHIKASLSGIELRVPPGWQVVAQLRATLGAIEDKTTPEPSPGHRLVLRGEVVLGGLEIKN
jgi:hypothetical protein